MALKFESSYPNATIWVSILWYHPDCTNGLFMKTGWWSLTDGQTVEVFTGDIDDLNRYYYFYAEASDGAVWSGPTNVEVTNAAYSQCVWDNKSCNRTVGFQILDIGDNDDFTVNLVPPGYTGDGGDGDGWSGDGDGDGDGDTGDGDGDGGDGGGWGGDGGDGDGDGDGGGGDGGFE
jgi:uncharacterized membrane protein